MCQNEKKLSFRHTLKHLKKQGKPSFRTAGQADIVANVTCTQQTIAGNVCHFRPPAGQTEKQYRYLATEDTEVLILIKSLKNQYIHRPILNDITLYETKKKPDWQMSGNAAPIVDGSMFGQ